MCIADGIGWWVRSSQYRSPGSTRGVDRILDDDDEWLPEKIEKQLGAVSKREERQSQIACSQVIARTADVDMLLPENAPSEPYSEYLLVRSRLTFGEGLMQTSTLMAKRQYPSRIPFTKGLRKHQDWDWVLRCAEDREMEVVFVAEPLAIWNVDDARTRVSQQSAWAISLDWIRSSRARVTARAYASFLATYVSPQAAVEGSWKTCWMIFKEMLHLGKPRLRDLVVFAGAWFFPVGIRQKLRGFLRGREASRSARELEATP